MDDGSARIELRRKAGPNLWAVIDQADLERVQEHRWRALATKWTTYVGTTLRTADGRERTTLLHRFILEPGPGLVVDHIDHDGLNNRRSNLRIATTSLNGGNMLRATGGTSQFKGVCLDRGRVKCWVARISINNKISYLGRFRTEIEAALAYDAAAREGFGEFALVNFPDRAA